MFSERHLNPSALPCMCWSQQRLGRRPLDTVGCWVQALDLQHPDKLTRDTARFPPLMKAHPAEGTRPQARRLRDLAKEVLGLVIQKSEHSPIDDARASLYLYHRHAKVRTGSPGLCGSESAQYQDIADGPAGTCFVLGQSCFPGETNCDVWRNTQLCCCGHPASLSAALACLPATCHSQSCHAARPQESKTSHAGRSGRQRWRPSGCICCPCRCSRAGRRTAKQMDSPWWS